MNNTEKYFSIENIATFFHSPENLKCPSFPSVSVTVNKLDDTFLQFATFNKWTWRLSRCCFYYTCAWLFSRFAFLMPKDTISFPSTRYFCTIFPSTVSRRTGYETGFSSFRVLFPHALYLKSLPLRWRKHVEMLYRCAHVSGISLLLHHRHNGLVITSL